MDETQRIEFRLDPIGEGTVEHPPGVLVILIDERQHDDGERLVAGLAVLVQHRLGRQRDVHDALHLLFQDLVAVAELVGGVDLDGHFAVGSLGDGVGHHHCRLVGRVAFRRIMSQFEFDRAGWGRNHSGQNDASRKGREFGEMHVKPPL